jgi:hypothetical protein
MKKIWLVMGENYEGGWVTGVYGTFERGHDGLLAALEEHLGDCPWLSGKSVRISEDCAQYDGDTSFWLQEWEVE